MCEPGHILAYTYKPQVCLALVPQGVAATDGTLWSIFSRCEAGRAHGVVTRLTVHAHVYMCLYRGSFPQPLLAVPVFLFVENVRALVLAFHRTRLSLVCSQFLLVVAVGLGFAAGAMTTVAIKVTLALS